MDYKHTFQTNNVDQRHSNLTLNVNHKNNKKQGMSYKNILDIF